jgi:hypothetical protein
MSLSTLKIDHVTIAGPDLAEMERAFAALGLHTNYGGPHSNGVTHMALLGFDDGSYIELISFLEPGSKETVFWSQHIAGNGGPCGWAVQADDVAAEAARVAALGVTVKGPDYMNRRRPDGKLVEWELAFLGDQGAGATLPFIIKDITPRQWRVLPSASVAGRLAGVAKVILGVKNLEAASALFQRVYGWPAPQTLTDAAFGAKLANFTGAPVTLAAPLATDGWLLERLARFGESPCAYLLSATNFEAACQDFRLTPSTTWFERRVAWFGQVKLNGVKLGLIA